jgi:putative ABC transport system permease protein
MTYRELFEQASQGLRSHRLRATLSLLGIVVGIGTVVASLAIGEGARRAAMADIGALGIDNVFVRAVMSAGNAAPANDSAHQSRATAPELTREDAAALRSRVAGIDAVTVTRWVHAQVGTGARTATAAVVGVSPDWIQLNGLDCTRGRCLTVEDERSAHRVAVLGAGLARRIGSGRDVVGLSLAVDDEIFDVVGVLRTIERRAGAAALQAFSTDDAVLVPASAMDLQLGDGDTLDRVSEIGVHIASGADVETVSATMARLLRQSHTGATDRYEFVVPRELLGARLRTQRTFDGVLLATGCIALIIAGVGIMNVMLASVTERKQEIGVRMAVGARQRDVVAQFTLEAGLLCLGGGVIGVPFGALFSWGVSLFAAWPVAVSVSGVALSLALAVGVGLTFGSYPAYLAASIDPIDALRA